MMTPRSLQAARTTREKNALTFFTLPFSSASSLLTHTLYTCENNGPNTHTLHTRTQNTTASLSHGANRTSTRASLSPPPVARAATTANAASRARAE